MNRERTAILVVNYGCADAGAAEKTYDRIEADIRAAYPAYPVRHAWTSQVLRRKLSEREGILIPGVKEAMEELRAKGIQRVVVQPTYVQDGLENRRMTADIQTCSKDFLQIVIGCPLLSSHRDQQKVVRVIGEKLRPSEEEALVLMGHGTGGSQDAAYGEMNVMFGWMGYRNVFLGAMEGEPDLDAVLMRVRERRLKRIRLGPFLITASKHVARDMAGEQKTSWKNRIQEAGFPVECIWKGLGEYEGIRRIFVEHTNASMEAMKDRQ